MNVLLVVVTLLAGGLGAVARFVVDGLVREAHESLWPWGTLLVNVLGSALLGGLTGASIGSGMPHPAVIVLGTGFCGGFTTMSTASVEVVRMLLERQIRMALGYLFGSLTLRLAAAGLGFALLS